MSKFNKETEKSIRIVLPLNLYNAVKEKCIDYGDISRLIRHLIIEWIKSKGTIRQVYDHIEELKESVETAKKLSEVTVANREALRREIEKSQQLLNEFKARRELDDKDLDDKSGS